MASWSSERKATHTLGEVIGMCVLGAIVVGFLVFSVMRDQSGMDARAGSVNTCQAPCLVTFEAPMAEDDLSIDYSAGTLMVRKSGKH